MRLCEWPGCERPYKTKTFCNMHFKRWQKGQDMDAPPKIFKASGLVCSYQGCDQPYRAGGYCYLHYERSRKGRDMDAPLPQTGEQCFLSFCDLPYFAKGLCGPHYNRQRLGMSIDEVVEIRQFTKGKICDQKGCFQPVKSKNLCLTHYNRLRAGVDLSLPIKPRRLKINTDLLNDPVRLFELPWSDRKGYKSLNALGKVFLQHRVVWEVHNGRPLEKFENIHHKNRIRDDNRIENLELWTKPQPCGQRPEDLVAWVIDHYRELVEARLALF